MQTNLIGRRIRVETAYANKSHEGEIVAVTYTGGWYLTLWYVPEDGCLRNVFSNKALILPRGYEGPLR